MHTSMHVIAHKKTTLDTMNPHLPDYHPNKKLSQNGSCDCMTVCVPRSVLYGLYMTYFL